MSLKKGDSVGQNIRARSEHLLRSQRLGMGSPRTVPHEQIKSATLQLLARTQSIGLMNRNADAELLCLLQLNLPLPLHVLLRTPIGQGPDVSLDLNRGCVCFDRDQLISRRFDKRKDLGLIQIPIPLEIKKALLARNTHKNDQLFIGDLFLKESDVKAEVHLKKLHQQALQRACGKTGTLAPGKWADSIPSLYLQTLGNETLAAICSLSPGLCNPGVLHYAKPSPDLIWQSIHQVFSPLGLGDIEPLKLDLLNTSETQKYPSDESIYLGIKHLVQEARHANSEIQISTQPHELIKSFNTCAGITCALLLISVAGRATKIQELHWGSLLTSEELLHINDKNIREEEGSRLIAKTPLSRWAINTYIQALHSIEQALSHHRLKVIFAKEANRKLSSFYFSKSAFVSLELKANEILCTPLTAKVIESITTKTFGFHKNFMRHALINHWYESNLDALLLRSITGHARIEFEAPSISCSYSPKSLFLSAGKDLAHIFKKWTPANLTVTAPSPSILEKVSHQNLTNAYLKSKKQIQKQREGITYTQWHLLGERVTKAIQTKLINTHPTDSMAHLWLMLVCIEGITDKKDLTQILSIFDLTKEPRGWLAKWERVGSDQYCTQILHEPTARLLCAIQKNSTPIELGEVTEQVDQWLLQQSQTDPLLREIFTSKKPPHESLLACASLYLDLQVPTSLQYCNLSTSYAAYINTASVLKLMGRRELVTLPALKRSTYYKSKAVSLEKLDAFISLVYELGENAKNHGESRKRASKYEAASTALGLPYASGWVKDLDLVVRFNCKLIKNDQAGKIQFSSLRTYISHLKYYFYESPELPPNVWDEESAIDLSKRLFELPPSSHRKILDDKKIEKRLSDQSDAATWLLKSLRALGYYVPMIFPNKDGTSQHASAICFVSKADLLNAKNFVNASVSTELERLQSQLALELLSCAPMRWMECATLQPKHLIQRTNDLSIESSGFSHIKSYSSTRHIKLPESVANKFTHLAQRIQEMEFTPSHFLFFKSTEKNKANAAKANWINRTLQQALAQSTGDATFRVHHLRANRICENIYPSLEKHLELWLKNPQSHRKNLSKYFAYSSSNAWVVDQACTQAGHAHPSTTLKSYLFMHPIARYLAIGSSLDSALLSTSIERDMLTSKKENCEHAKLSKGTPASKLLKPSHTLDDPAIDGVPLTEELSMQTTCRYWSLRLLGRNQTTVCDDLEISLQDAVKLERLLKSSKAWGLSQSQPSTKVKLSFENFENFLKALSLASNLELKCLIELLKGEPKVEHWEDQLKKIAVYLSAHQFKLELVSNQLHTDLQRNAQLALVKGIEIGVAKANWGIKHQVLIHPNHTDISLKTRQGDQKTFLAITQSIVLWNSINKKGGINETSKK
jgi:hypothetical protein